MLDKHENRVRIAFVRTDAGVAHPVERHLAKVEVASSSLVARSKKAPTFVGAFYFMITEQRGSSKGQVRMLDKIKTGLP